MHPWAQIIVTVGAWS